jgi:Cu/Ag efflux protein CusF
MKTAIIILILILTGLTVCIGSGLTAEKRKTSRYPGLVQDVDLKAETIVVGKERKNLGMLFHASKTIFTNIAGLKDLKPGDKVVVEYDAKLGQTIAVTITKE